MRRQHPLLAALSAALLPLVVTSCSSGSDDSQVTSLSSAGTDSPTATSTADPEDQLIAYVACLREQGLDVPDPTADANGDLSLNGGAAAGTIDRAALAAAQEACGAPPEGAVGGTGTHEQSPEFQDAALKFAECMRGEGLDFPDPDFTAAGGGGGGGGIFGEFDQNDPAVQKCQSIFTDAGITPGGQR